MIQISIRFFAKKFFTIALLIVSTSLTLSGAQAKEPQKATKIFKSKARKLTSSTIVGENQHFEKWKDVQEFKLYMQSQYQFPAEEFEHIMREARFVDSAIQAVKPMPAGKPKNWRVYRSRFVETARVEAGLKFWNRNEAVLKKAEQEYGVPAEIIVGLIGVETIYGKNLGRYRAIDALTSLAFSYPETPNREARINFFRNELAQLLLWSREKKIDIFSIKSSYAGAIGLCQFMPSSLRDFAVDFDRDGKTELRDSEADAIGSVANYLLTHGWKKTLPYVFPASLHIQESATENKSEVTAARLKNMLERGLKASLRLEELQDFITTPSADAPKDILYGVIDLQNGEEPTEYWLATENFYAITQYNRSYFYAMSVIDLAQAISNARTKD